MKKPEASTAQHGSMESGLMALMRRTGVPLTREHYLNLKHLGEPPQQLGPEEQEELDRLFPKPSPKAAT